MKQFTDFIFRVIGIMALAVSLIPAYCAESMVGECIAPYQWEHPHSHPEMIHALIWMAGAFPFLLLGIKHGLFCNIEKGHPSLLKSFAFALFWILPAITLYANELAVGCPYATELQDNLLWAAFIIAICSLCIYCGLISHQKPAEKRVISV